MRDGGLHEDARMLCSEFGLCESCLGRLLARGGRRVSTRTLGRRLLRHAVGDGDGGGGGERKCFVCRGMMEHLDSMAKTVLEVVSGYDFETFSVGATLKPSVLDRDDYIRSRTRARGADSIKAALTGDLGRLISEMSGRALDRADPDVTVVLDTRFGSCEVRSKHVVVQARYTKTRRGIAQKRNPCMACSGDGCGDCGFTGSSGESVESLFAGFLMDEVGGTGVRFTWVGGEDRDSLVLGDGRRLYAQVRNPVRRNRRLPDAVSLGGIRFGGISFAPDVPAQIPRFRSTIRIRVEAADPPGPGALRRLRMLVGPISVGDPSGRVASRQIHSLRYRRISEGAFRMTIDADGGLPVKRLVGGQDVDPSVSGVLGVDCSCIRFDFLSVRENN